MKLHLIMTSLSELVNTLNLLISLEITFLKSVMMPQVSPVYCL